MNSQAFHGKTSIWGPPPTSMTLDHQDVHIWRASLDILPEMAATCWNSLSHDERERAIRFKFQKHRDRFVAARGILRAILGNYLDLAPQDILFETGPYGKPYVPQSTSSRQILFNMTHSQGLGLYAISCGRELGVDVEAARTNLDQDLMAKRIFTEQEYLVYDELAPVDKKSAFFNCWSRKEAYVKARGDGLAFPFCRITVTFAPGETPALVAIEGEEQEPLRWSMLDIDPGEGYTAALVVEGTNWKPRYWDWAVD